MQVDTSLISLSCVVRSPHFFLNSVRMWKQHLLDRSLSCSGAPLGFRRCSMCLPFGRHFFENRASEAQPRESHTESCPEHLQIAPHKWKVIRLSGRGRDSNSWQKFIHFVVEPRKWCTLRFGVVCESWAICLLIGYAIMHVAPENRSEHSGSTKTQETFKT